MTSNAVLLVLPPIGSNTDTLIVIGDNQVYVDRSIRAVMLLICDFYVACIKKYGFSLSDRSRYSSETGSILASMESICRTTGAEIILHERFVEITGEKGLVRRAYEAMIATDYFKVFLLKLTMIECAKCQVPTRIGLGTSRIYQREKEWQNQQDYQNERKQSNVPREL
jgi:hypothetical protein